MKMSNLLRFSKIIFVLVIVQLSYQNDFADLHQNITTDLTFNVRRNQTGHYITQWWVRNKSFKLPDNMKINMRSSKTENGGFQTYLIQGSVIVPPPKPAGYELFPGVGYYKFYPDGANNYHEASRVCINDGGHLAIVNSAAENNVLTMIFSRYPKAKDWAYVGFHDMEVEGKFVTIFGDPLESTGFSEWFPGQPDQGEGNEDCGSMHRNGKINDLWCDKRGPWSFFCEYDLSWEEI